MQTISPFLWFDSQAEEAAKFYVSVFGKDSRIVKTIPGPNGAVMGVDFVLLGQPFQALNGGPQFKFTPAISLFVSCDTQAEVDELWKKLSAGGEEQQCGWLQDKYGLSWQVIPRTLGRLLTDPNPGKSQRAMQAMLQMRKIDIAALEVAAQG